MQDSNIEYVIVYERSTGYEKNDTCERFIISVHKTEEEAIAKCKEMVAKSHHTWQSGAPWIGIDSAIWTVHYKDPKWGTDTISRWLSVRWQFPDKPKQRMVLR